jgi:glutamyl-Q tRNA(Asp) synthetase
MLRSDLPGAGYIGRFAPSPTGTLHAGSLVAALGSWLDARAHGGRWLVRIEDLDVPRCLPGADARILAQLAACGLTPDEPPLWQSARSAHYEDALQRLLAADRAYPCGCSRREIELAMRARGHSLPRHGELVYPGTCRDGLQGKAARAVRLRTVDADGHDTHIDWIDRRLGAQRQALSQAVGDFVLQRADGWWAYQLAVVVDDALQGISHVVRGEDLADNTPRQIHLQRLLGLPTPSYLHLPLVLGANGEKLSKQNGAQPLDLSEPLVALKQSAATLGIVCPSTDRAEWLAQAVQAWRDHWQLPVA